MKKKKIIVVLIVILFIGFLVYTRFFRSSESTASETTSSESAEVTSASSDSSVVDASDSSSSESSEDDVTVTTKSAAEMDSLYGSYLTENPVDFFSGEVEISITSLDEIPVMTVDTDESGIRYFCLAVGESSYEEYISGDTAYICISDETGESWSAKTLTADAEESDVGLTEITNLFEQVIDAMNLGSVYDLIASAPELSYQRTLTIGGTELDLFAAVLSTNSGLISGNLSEDEYEEYMQALEEEAERMKELLEEDEDILFEIDEEEVGYCYLYIDSSNENLRFINATFGEDSSVSFIFRDNETSYAEDIPGSTGDYNEEEISAFFETLLTACA